MGSPASAGAGRSGTRPTRAGRAKPTTQLLHRRLFFHTFRVRSPWVIKICDFSYIWKFTQTINYKLPRTGVVSILLHSSLPLHKAGNRQFRSDEITGGILSVTSPIQLYIVSRPSRYEVSEISGFKDTDDCSWEDAYILNRCYDQFDNQDQ
jgi:hypothetical protein